MTKGHARIIGVVYLIFFLTSILSDILLKGLVQNDAAATASHILTHESWFRLGIAGGLVETGFYVALTALLYHLFKPVNRTVSLVRRFSDLLDARFKRAAAPFNFFRCWCCEADRQSPDSSLSSCRPWRCCF